MLCYGMLCYVMSCHVMSCRVVSCRVVSCRVVLCCVMLCYVMSCYVMSCFKHRFTVSDIFAQPGKIMFIFYKPIDHNLNFYDRMFVMKSLKLYSDFVKSGIYVKPVHLVHFIGESSIIFDGISSIVSKIKRGG